MNACLNPVKFENLMNLKKIVVSTIAFFPQNNFNFFPFFIVGFYFFVRNISYLNVIGV